MRISQRAAGSFTKTSDSTKNQSNSNPNCINHNDCASDSTLNSSTLESILHSAILGTTTKSFSVSSLAMDLTKFCFLDTTSGSIVCQHGYALRDMALIQALQLRDAFSSSSGSAGGGEGGGGRGGGWPLMGREKFSSTSSRSKFKSLSESTITSLNIKCPSLSYCSNTNVTVVRNWQKNLELVRQLASSKM